MQEISATYHSFGRQGGWGDYGDISCYDDFPGPDLTIDQETWDETLPPHSIFIPYDDFISMKSNFSVGDEVLLVCM